MDDFGDIPFFFLLPAWVAIPVLLFLLVAWLINPNEWAEKCGMAPPEIGQIVTINGIEATVLSAGLKNETVTLSLAGQRVEKIPCNAIKTSI